MPTATVAATASIPAPVAAIKTATVAAAVRVMSMAVPMVAAFTRARIRAAGQPDSAVATSACVRRIFIAFVPHQVNHYRDQKNRDHDHGKYDEVHDTINHPFTGRVQIFLASPANLLCEVS